MCVYLWIYMYFSGGSRGGHRGHVPPPPPPPPFRSAKTLLSVASYIRVRVACAPGAIYIRVRMYYCEPTYTCTCMNPWRLLSASSQLSPASFHLHHSAELQKKTPFRLTKPCSCRMIPWARKRGRHALKRRSLPHRRPGFPDVRTAL